MLQLIGRTRAFFDEDISENEAELSDLVTKSRFLVIGGAGSIGQAVCREIFKRNPRALHVVDISENNMVELVRDIRSALGYIQGDFRTFAIDCGSKYFAALATIEGPYDYVLNLSALKHVRSEKDPFTLLRMVEVNISNTLSTLDLTRRMGAQKYFCVSTDKAANPVNLMGASKRVMEMFLMRESGSQTISTARFANVAFSDGSLLHGFNQRFAKRQPISAPTDVRRYFLTPQESGELCLMSCLLGRNRDIFFPKPSGELTLTTFSSIAVRYLAQFGYEAVECESEEEARRRFDEFFSQRRWPCYFFSSDTTGEKDFEEFYTGTEKLDMGQFHNIGVVLNELPYDSDSLDSFLRGMEKVSSRVRWSKADIVDLFNQVLPNFNHKETGKYLDQRM